MGSGVMSVKESPPSVPTVLDQVTTEWLSRALDARFPGAEVIRLDIGRVIHGTATKVRLMLEYNASGHAYGLPPTLWLKAGLEAHSAQQEKVYQGEARFYADLAHQLPIGCPKAYFAHIDPVTGNSALLLEDLLARNVRFTDARSPLGLTEAARVVQLLARMHGAFWTRDSLEACSWLKPGGALKDSGIIEAFFDDPIWGNAMTQPRSKYATGKLRDRSLLRAVMLRLLKRDRRLAHCLVHGDSHVGNLCFDRQGNPVYVDWQTVMLGHWAHDVGNFIPLALTPTDRRHAEKDLLALYLAELGEQGVVAPPFEQAWFEYRCHALYTYNFVLCPPELQTEEICVASAERACAAISDLGSLDACAQFEV